MTPARPAHRVDALTPIPLRNQRRIETPDEFEQITVPFMGGEVSCAVGYEDGELQLHLIEMGGWFSALDMLSDKVFRELEAAAIKAYERDNAEEDGLRRFEELCDSRAA